MTLTQWFILPFLGHFALVALLYVWLTVLRQSAVAKGEVRIGDFVNAGADPSRSKRVARNLSNQFELPVFALFAATFIYFSQAVTAIDVFAAWLFLAGRLIHSAVQTLTSNIPLRGMVFLINFVSVMILMGRVVWLALAI
ncbi:MAPEG family protein [Asticcacaulis tiandongensis]|uniref:MAPEG family protein n=1 Tax=Asticcacaulis tiandongensis TaxID=2565365 RepID=UPI00112B76BC|nr:MAPEG family protein [Asticcacaulis tiandongensis]